MPKSSDLKCYFGCDLDGPLHRFPKWEYPFTEKFNEWKSVLDSKTQERGNNYIYNCIRICHRHFKDYFKSRSKRLTKNAVPTLNINAKLLLYKNDASAPSSSVRILGDMLGLEFDFKDIDFITKEHKSYDFLKINAMGTVPTLKDGEFVLSESHAIMKYLLDVYGGDQKEVLYPSDPKTRAIIDQCMFFDTGVLFIRMREISTPTVFDGAKRPNRKQKQGIEDAYSVLESYLQNTPYLAGDHLTLADIGTATTTNALEIMHKVDSYKFPHITSWLAKMNAHPSFKSINAPGLVVYKKLLKFYWDKNESNA